MYIKKKGVYTRACLAGHRKALKGHKNLVAVVAFGGGNWDTED